MLNRIHPISGGIAFLIILTFWTSTIVSELFGTTHTIVAVKHAIPWGFILLVPALAATGGSGFRLSGKSSDSRILAKKQRMVLIAANGLLILMPCAIALSVLASSAHFSSLFYAIQVLELFAGAMNLTLISLNIRDGLSITQRFASWPTGHNHSRTRDPNN